MATKANAAMHSAGIYSDMTVDGPEIGTLVVIVDRAKNLPNRKSIGKQDPYCAARLGKEAKKTGTDIRGGQTPKWDQELRFTVHDSPDYYQLKVSVFNDDKKTDLIGETWVNLQDILVPGGGQNDIWHSLNYRGKYAGEIRIEITYYDTRPKQEKVSERVRQAIPNGQDGGRDSLSGPRHQQKAPVKRRPLPSDPTQPSPSPISTPEHFQEQPRTFHTPPAYIQSQSPLQALEYNTPPPQQYSQLRQGYGQSPPGVDAYGSSPGMIASHSASRPLHNDRHNSGGGSDYNDSNFSNGYDDSFEDQGRRSQAQYSHQHVSYELPSNDEYGSPPSPGRPPPPPPAHRSNHGSPAASANSSYGFSPLNAPREDPRDLSRQSNYRHSMPGYAQDDPYQTYSQPSTQNMQRPYSNNNNNNFQQLPPRHHSYDDRYQGNYGSMQPSVEDAPASPGPSYSQPRRNDGGNRTQYEDPRYGQVPSPAPLNLSGRGSAASGHYSAGSGPIHTGYTGAASNGSPLPYRDYNQIGTNEQREHQHHHQRRRTEDPMRSTAGFVPSVPPSLVAGMDPLIAQEVSERMYNEDRASWNQNIPNTARTRYPDQSQYRTHSLQSQDSAPQPFVPAASNYDDRQSRLITNTYTPVVKPRAISPDPRMPMRKSVSPAPLPSGSGETRRLSGIPFGPDAYNELNPNVPVAATSGGKYNTSEAEVDPNAKIIMHDGREVDPSDHLPEQTWAALPPHQKKAFDNPSPARGRPSPSGAQPMPPAGRRPFRESGRPMSMASPASSPMYGTGVISDPSTPVSTGRNRLQKKSNRQSALPPPHSSPLAPVSTYQDNSYAQRPLPRARTMEFAGENGYGSYGGEGAGYRGNSGGPPVPGKLPIQQGPPPPPPEENAWALLEEMKSIDLGAGRARRRGHNHAVV